MTSSDQEVTKMPTATPQPSVLATRRGKLILALLASVAFIDFVDASIVNIALPSIRRDLGFSEQGLQWVPSAYLLTYGGFMLLGGRAADLLGRRRILVAGTVLIGVSSLIGGFAGSSGVLVAARLAQGIGAAMMLPAALSILTTTFKEGSDRNKALGIWGGMGGLASAAGVLLGGMLTEGPGWRWVMFVNPIAAVLVLGGIYLLLADDRRRAQLANFDLRGAILATSGMLLLVFTLVEAPDQGWDSTRTIAELAGAFALLAAFVVNEQRGKNPLLPLSIFRTRGLAAADVTQLIAFAGFLAVFFFLTLYAERARLLADPDRRRVSPGHGRRRDLRGHRLAAPLPHRDPAPDRRRFADRRERRLLPLPHPGRWLLRFRPAAGPGGHVARPRRRVRRRDHGRERGRASRGGRTGGVASQRLAAGRRRARVGNLLRDRHLPDDRPAGGPRLAGGRPHLGLSPGAVGVQPLPRGGRSDRPAHRQHARGAGGRRRG